MLSDGREIEPVLIVICTPLANVVSGVFFVSGWYSSGVYFRLIEFLIDLFIFIG